MNLEKNIKKRIIPIWEQYLSNKWEKDYTTLYIHFPYCKQRCSYCMHHNFLLPNESAKNEYLDLLEKQFKIASPIFSDESIKSLYIGGGSPSILDTKQTIKLLNLIEKYFKIDPDINNMFSIESHSSQLSKNKIDILSKSYINRVSIGVQSLDGKVLNSNNRIPLNLNIFNDNLLYLLDSFKPKKSRINIDLMYGLKDQTEESFLKDIEYFFNLNIPKLTVYAYRNTTKNRPIKNEKAYREIFVSALLKIKESNYIKTSPVPFNEFNSFIHKEIGPKWMYQYNTMPLYFNNTISFGYGNHSSYFFPINKTIHYGEKYLFVDKIRIGNLKEMFRDSLDWLKNERELRKDIQIKYDYEYIGK
jgi:oxygen-independent coproporphyrinogen-3 oxidase